jgi:hypothetical protein
MQLYYYMQKLQTAGMGNPKERKECPICGKTLYDRSTWNRHMRIHTGKVGLSRAFHSCSTEHYRQPTKSGERYSSIIYIERGIRKYLGIKNLPVSVSKAQSSKQCSGQGSI